MDGVWLLPTRGRIGNLRRFLNAAREMGTSTPGWILINDDEWSEWRHEYEPLLALAPRGWSFVPVHADSYGAALRAVWNKVEHMRWVGLVSDDLVPCTSTWDVQLLAALQGWNFVSSNDGWQAPQRMHGAVAWSGDLLRAVGYLFPPGLRHIFHDDLWEGLGRETGCWQVRMDIMCRHLHESLEGVRGPTMDSQSALWQHDEAWFRDWEKAEKAETVERVRGLMTRYGVTTMKPDFTGVSLMIGTPAIDGSYDSAYVVGLYATMKMLQENGVLVQWAEEKYTADISLARSKILGAFLRTSATHLLMIDADMGWEPEAVMRLFCAKKEFVAIAGPKKRYPLSFAANFTDRDGNPIMLTFDAMSGTMEVGEVGSAFALVTRGMAERMVAGYPELVYVGVTGDLECALFNPMIENRRYYSEDFAFCARWRALGGTVHIVPDIALKHTGSHCFSGSFSQMAQQQRAEFELRAAAE